MKKTSITKEECPTWVEEKLRSCGDTYEKLFPENMKEVLRASIMNSMYQCAMCNEVLNKGLTDEEAEEQYKREFKGRNQEELLDENLVCDDCFKGMTAVYPLDEALDDYRKETDIVL